MAEPTFRKPRFDDTRHASAYVDGARPLCTQRGKDPIAPHSIEAVYDIPTGKVYGVKVVGPRLKPKTRGEGYVRRRIDLGLDVEPWIRKFVEEHRPRKGS